MERAASKISVTTQKWKENSTTAEIDSPMLIVNMTPVVSNI